MNKSKVVVLLIFIISGCLTRINVNGRISVGNSEIFITRIISTRGDVTSVLFSLEETTDSTYNNLSNLILFNHGGPVSYASRDDSLFVYSADDPEFERISRYKISINIVEPYEMSRSYVHNDKYITIR